LKDAGVFFGLGVTLSSQMSGEPTSTPAGMVDQVEKGDKGTMR
jgi:hypothetical protein